MQKLIYFLLVIVLLACGKKYVPVSEKKQETNTEYSEDLSEFRDLLTENSNVKTIPVDNINPPPITTEPLYINDKIDALLKERTEKNKGIKYANGYRIQLYVGRERKVVDEAKIYIYQTFPNINPYLTYSLPMYKLKIGDFLTRNDAERFLNQLKDLYPEAIIVPEKIDIKKSFMKE
ncbi:MAG: SPOR domain-containing protein [Bacteroidota bacterium]